MTSGTEAPRRLSPNTAESMSVEEEIDIATAHTSQENHIQEMPITE